MAEENLNPNIAQAPSEAQDTGAPSDVSKEEQIGFHKGALSTLSKERQEMLKILQIVEQLMQMHISALKELGVDLEAQAKEMAGGKQQSPQNPGAKPKAPIEDMLR
ncbi:hypothetical protein JW868_00855 [Candidatus Woesearchaeota archaeon]|nr:hypothetical protein [Candidatus Woesearchaeota archaeon]